MVASRLRLWRNGCPGRLIALGCAGLLALYWASYWASPALAADEGPDKTGITGPSIATSLPNNGDPYGTRAWLASLGLTYQFVYTHDILANLHGGLRQGVVDQGKLEYNMTYDFEKLTDWKGLSFYTNIFFIHNTGRFRRDFVGGINTIAAIEANSTVRLSELWLEQKFWNDKASLRVGQLAADVEFFFSVLSFPFLQSDWATITALCGARLRASAAPHTAPVIHVRFFMTGLLAFEA